MATSVIFDLIDTLHTRATAALPTTTVLDGMGATDDPGDFLMIGIEDPDTDGFSESAESTQEWAGVGNNGRRYEKGTVSCCALSWNGDSGNAGQKAARDAAQAILAAVETLLRGDPDLGDVVTGLHWIRIERVTLRQIQDKDGSAALVFFQVAFLARL